MLDPTENMDDFYNDNTIPVVQAPPSHPILPPASAVPCPPRNNSSRSDAVPVSVNPTAYGKLRLDQEGGSTKDAFYSSSKATTVDAAGSVTVGSHATQAGELDGPRTIRATDGIQQPRPKLQGVIGGTLDGANPRVEGNKQRAQFAVSQLHGVFLALQRNLMSKAVSWRDFLHLPSFQKPQTGAMAVDRIERNLRYFYMNYVIICSAMVVLAAVLNPIILVIAGLSGGAYAFAGLKGDTLRLGDTIVPVRTFRLGCVVVAALTILLVAGNVVVSLLLGCTVLVLIHACMHVGVSYEQIAQRTAGDAEFDV